MKKSSVLLSFAIAIATVFTTSGCAMQESYDSYIPDPFETFESNTLIGDDIKETRRLRICQNTQQAVMSVPLMKENR